MKIRLSFAEVPDPDVKFWSDRLKSFGLKVTSARESGIDAEGEPEAIEQALGARIETFEGSPPRIDRVGIEESAGKAPPVAYFPREPTFF